MLKDEDEKGWLVPSSSSRGSTHSRYEPFRDRDTTIAGISLGIATASSYTRQMSHLSHLIGLHSYSGSAQ